MAALSDTDILRVISLFSPAKYMGKKPSHMTQVAYIVNPINLASLKFSGRFLV